MQAWLSKRITFLSLIPVLFLVAFICYSFVKSMNTLGDARLTQYEVELSKLTYSLLSEVQKERGMSAGFIGSKGNSFSQELPLQRQKVDAALQALIESDAAINVYFAEENLLNPLDNLTQNISNWRNQVTSLTTTVPETVSNYTQVASLLIEFQASLVNYVESANAKQSFILIFKLSQLQEYSGLERAMLSNLFAIGSPNDQQLNAFKTNITNQESLLNNLRVLSNEEFAASLSVFANSAAVKAVAPYRQQLAEYPDTPLSADSEEWFKTSTARIGELGQLIGASFTQINKYASNSYSASIAYMAFNAALLIVSVLLTAAIYSVLKTRQNQSSELKNKLSLLTDQRDLTQIIKQCSNDDLGDVALKINDLVDLIKTDLLEFQNSAYEITFASSQVAESSEVTRENINIQSSNVTQSLSAAELLNAGINADLESISKVAEYTKRSSEAVKEGEELVAKAVADIHETAREVNNVGVSIDLLNNKVGDILKMVDVIRSVAEQTNLLALNAAIEAARAGEQGRGFAVVADEVRALAKRVQESTQEIAAVVDELRDSSSHAFDAIAKGAERANNTVTMADSIRSALQLVSTNMTELEEFSIAVEQSAQQQSFSLDGMTSGIREIDNMSDRNAEGAEKVAVASHQLAASANSMLDNISKYST